MIANFLPDSLIVIKILDFRHDYCVGEQYKMCCSEKVTILLNNLVLSIKSRIKCIMYIIKSFNKGTLQINNSKYQSLLLICFNKA